MPSASDSEASAEIRAAYADASLSLADGMPLIWASRIAGDALPEKVSGSDLVRPLLMGAARRGLGVYLLGAAPGVAQKAAGLLVEEIPGLRIVGFDSPPLGFEKDPELERRALDKMRYASPDLALVALGCPKQELLMHRWSSQDRTPVMLGIGASLDFIAGKVKRSPPWMSRIGLEWVYRIIQDPKRLARRYLIQDSAIVGIILRTLRLPKNQRVFYK